MIFNKELCEYETRCDERLVLLILGKIDTRLGKLEVNLCLLRECTFNGGLNRGLGGSIFVGG